MLQKKLRAFIEKLEKGGELLYPAAEFAKHHSRIALRAKAEVCANAIPKLRALYEQLPCESESEKLRDLAMYFFGEDMECSMNISYFSDEFECFDQHGNGLEKLKCLMSISEYEEKSTLYSWIAQELFEMDDTIEAEKHNVG